MDAAARRTKKRVPTRAIWLAAIGTAFAIHGTVLGAANGVDFGLSHFVGTDVPKVEPVLVDLEINCEGDAMLAASARAAMCLTPWNRDTPECKSIEDLELLMWMDLSACRGRDQQSIPAVAMSTVQPRELEKVAPIDAEMLLDELKKEQQPPPPPPVPQLQPQQPPPPPPPAPAPPPPKRPAQVVETAKPNTEKEPDNARLLAEHNTQVEKQKVARGAVKEPMVAKSKPAELTPKEKPSEEPPAIAKKPEQVEPGKDLKAPQVPGTLSMRQPGAPAAAELPQDAMKKGVANEKSPIIANGGIPRRGDGAVEQQRRDPGQLTKGEGGAGGGAPPVPNLKPSKEQLERIVGGGSVDHLEEVENGDETALNAKRWVFASFFNRMKRQVAQNWDPQTVWRRADPQGTHHGFKTRITEVRVVLGPKGDLVKVTVTAPSGVRELDDEAVKSFHAAAPFPNPPDGLVSKDGNITFAFSFYFEIGQSRTSWRVIRQ